MWDPLDRWGVSCRFPIQESQDQQILSSVGDFRPFISHADSKTQSRVSLLLNMYRINM